MRTVFAVGREIPFIPSPGIGLVVDIFPHLAILLDKPGPAPRSLFHCTRHLGFS
jgi:hypothetical protein